MKNTFEEMRTRFNDFPDEGHNPYPHKSTSWMFKDDLVDAYNNTKIEQMNEYLEMRNEEQPPIPDTQPELQLSTEEK